MTALGYDSPNTPTPRISSTDSASIYVVLLIYAASTSTTTLPCLTTVLAVPRTEDPTAAFKTVAVTDAQLIMLLSSYVPFLLIPLFMTLDMAWRISKMIDVRTTDHDKGITTRNNKED